MVDNSPEAAPTSSQELSPFPLPEETLFHSLWNEMPPFYENFHLDISHFNNNVELTDIDGTLDLIPVVQAEDEPSVVPMEEIPSSSTSNAPSSLPASNNWSGPFNFNVTFGPQKKDTKGVSWTYSKMKDKLYVGKDVPCPINFCADTKLSDNMSVRAMALYRSPEHSSEIVRRCMNHSAVETDKGIFEADHLVRCESMMSSYQVDQTTRRHSVVVPYEIPAVGQISSTYIYKFTCFGSCVGGPHRRPIVLVFSLEKEGQVVGRRKLDVKICACPGRDRKAEELQMIPEKVKKPKRKVDQENVAESLADYMKFTKTVLLPPVKKVKNGKYTITVDNEEQYEFLVQTNKLYENCKLYNNLPPNVKKAFLQYNRSKQHEDEEE